MLKEKKTANNESEYEYRRECNTSILVRSLESGKRKYKKMLKSIEGKQQE